MKENEDMKKLKEVVKSITGDDWEESDLMLILRDISTIKMLREFERKKVS